MFRKFCKTLHVSYNDFDSSATTVWHPPFLSLTRGRCHMAMLVAASLLGTPGHIQNHACCIMDGIIMIDACTSAETFIKVQLIPHEDVHVYLLQAHTACLHTHACIRARTHTHTRMHPRTRPRPQTRTHTHTHTHTYKSIHPHPPTQTQSHPAHNALHAPYNWLQQMTLQLSQLGTGIPHG